VGVGSMSFGKSLPMGLLSGYGLHILKKLSNSYGLHALKRLISRI